MKLYIWKVHTYTNNVWIQAYGNPSGHYCYEANVGGAYGGGHFRYSPDIQSATIYFSKTEALEALKKYGMDSKQMTLELLEYKLQNTTKF
jgi:hypothetical protein